MRVALILSLVSILLAGCATTSVVTCGPPLIQYSKDFQNKVAQEYDDIEDTAPHLTQMIDDYGKDRKGHRVCLDRMKKKK